MASLRARGGKARARSGGAAPGRTCPRSCVSTPEQRVEEKETYSIFSKCGTCHRSSTEYRATPPPTWSCTPPAYIRLIVNAAISSAFSASLTPPADASSPPGPMVASASSTPRTSSALRFGGGEDAEGAEATRRCATANRARNPVVVDTCGNLGAFPNPPFTLSNWRASRAYAWCASAGMGRSAVLEEEGFVWYHRSEHRFCGE